MALALLGAGCGLAAWAARREQGCAIEKRQALLDGCVTVFDDVTKTIAPDGFPRLSGRMEKGRVRLSLVPDTLMPKRLPQLWLMMTSPGPLETTRLAVTARPRGDDFISAATDMRHQLRVPPWLPADCAVRGDDVTATGLWLLKLRAPLETAFADPRLKEIALGPKGVRLVYQACEGRRGAHLLLRQARFETAIDPAVVRRCRSILRDIDDAARHDAHREAA